MKYPTKRFFGLSWVGWLNVLILQWFFVRLQGAFDEHEDGTTATYWALILPVIPLTGWWSNYVPGTRREVWIGKKAPEEGL